MTEQVKKAYGWHPDKPDHRDMMFAAPAHAAALPVHVDLRPHCTPVYDQGDLGSCTANAIAAALDFERLKQSKPAITPSRLFIYYNERVMEGSVASDAGAEIRDGIKSVAQKGDCPESEWPYDVAAFTRKPTDKCYLDAKKARVIGYMRVSQVLGQMKGCLAAGFPFVFGFSVYDGFESDAVSKTGVLNMPAPDEQMQGGHAVMCVGYDDASQRFIVRNSWGSSWGQAGYFTIPYAYLTDPNLADDFWTIRIVM